MLMHRDPMFIRRILIHGFKMAVLMLVTVDLVLLIGIVFVAVVVLTTSLALEGS